MILENDLFPAGRLETLDHSFAVVVQAYLTAALMRLAALQEHALCSREPGDHRAFNDYAFKAMQSGQAAIDGLRILNGERVSTVKLEREPGGCHTVGDRRECWWWHHYSYCVDGVTRRRSCCTIEGSDDAALTAALEQERAEDLARVATHFESVLVRPVRHTISLLKEISEMSLRHPGGHRPGANPDKAYESQ
jgi:hypothetical protein